MTHGQSRKLQEYLDGTLSADEARDLEAHLAACAACRAELADLRLVDRALAAQPILAEPADLTARIMAQIAPEGTRPGIHSHHLGRRLWVAALQSRGFWPTSLHLHWEDAVISTAFAWSATASLAAMAMLRSQDLLAPRDLARSVWVSWMPRLDRLWHTVHVASPDLLVGVASTVCVAIAVGTSTAALARYCVRSSAARSGSS